MTEGFANPIIGGGGSLVYPSIHSPGFSAGPPIVGWSIDKNGDAYFSGTFGGNNYEITSAGAFFYSGTPAAGNLIASVASSAGTDHYGNAYLANVVSYAELTSSLYMATQLYVSAAGKGSAGLFVYTATSNAGPWTEAASLGVDSTGNIILATNLTSITLFAATNTISVSGPVSQDSWHSLPLAAGFAAGAQPPEYQLMPIGSTGQVHLRGAVTYTASAGSGVLIATLPAGYIPSTAQEWQTPNTVGSSLAGSVQVNTSGQLLTGEAGGSSGDVIRLDGIIIQL